MMFEDLCCLIGKGKSAILSIAVFTRLIKRNQVVRWKPFLDTFFNGAPLCRMKTSAEGAVVVSPMQASLDLSERPFPVYAVFLPNPFIPMILSEESWLLRRNPFG